jgi:hypothetical protein
MDLSPKSGKSQISLDGLSNPQMGAGTVPQPARDRWHLRNVVGKFGISCPQSTRWGFAGPDPQAAPA